MHFLPFRPLRMDHSKLLDVLTSLPVSQSILPRAVCFATSRPANHAICSFIDSSGYASGLIRRCLLIDYIISSFIDSSGYASGPIRRYLFIDYIIKYVKALYLLFISEMELRILNIDGPLIKVSKTDGRRLILHYVGILSFFRGSHL